MQDPQDCRMVFRKQLVDMLSVPRSVSSIARELGLKRAADVEDDLRHLIRSARAAGHRIEIEPARCKSCGFTFGTEKLVKPGKCPECRSTWLFEPMLRIESEAQ